MPILSREEAYQRFLKAGRNSSHFVWFMADLNYYESTNGWVFGYFKRNDVILIALEPIIPGAPVEYSEQTQKDFELAWHDFLSEVSSQVVAFVGIYKPMANLLKKIGFQFVKVGEEPWVDLSDCIPRGNTGKGVRSARNQALNAGVKIEEWSGTDLVEDVSKRESIQEICDEWKFDRAVNLGGFLNSVDPFYAAKDRRYFVAKKENGKVCAFLIATPIPGIQSYFLEDLMATESAPRGVGELLTLETMVALQESGVKLASLGVVSVTSMDEKAIHALPKPIQFFFHKVPNILRKFYNFDGLKTFRKRFKPKIWEDIHLAVLNRNPQQSDTRAWFQALITLLIAFRPRPQVGVRWCFKKIFRFVRDYPVTTFASVFSFSLFAGINHFGQIPAWALNEFGFTASAPWQEWVVRSFVSDYLYFDPVHFLVWGISYFFVIYWAESRNKARFFIPFFFLVSLFDDFINYFFIILPFEIFHPSLSNGLILFKDVGGSLGMVTLLGLQFCQFQRNREILFSIVSLGVVLAFVFDSAQLQAFVLNLNHFLFLTLGYIVGKIRFQMGQRKNAAASKGKAPQAKSVLKN